MKQLVLLALFGSVALCKAGAQVVPGDSSQYKQQDEIVVTATRTEKKLSHVAVPITIVSQKQIQATGALRLNDILQEQTGLFVTGTNGSGSLGGGIFGNGIQMQGLSPDYTMILLDGEPLIGRQGGIMDLSRFAVGNIKKIEIVKGPSSSLYGSEALAGVVNIITDPYNLPAFKAGLRYGSFNTQDAFVTGNTGKGSTKLYYFVNRNSSSGYDLETATPEKTADPFFNYTAQVKLTQRLSPNSKLLVNGRYFYGLQNAAYAINNKNINVTGQGHTHDYLVNPVWLHQLNGHFKNRLSVVASGYSFTQQLDSLSDGQRYYYDAFKQHFLRAEEQLDWNWKKHSLSAGGGFTLQTVTTTRYKQTQQQQQWHAFVQHEYSGLKNLRIISGLRFDYTRGFAARLSPKIAAQYQASSRLSFNASAGSGFKAPDFRQLYLNFTNNAGDGYSLFGASEFSIAEMQRQQSLGLIAQLLPAAFDIRQLLPEISTGYNLGARYQLATTLRAEINLFRNDIRNLINFVPVATNSNGTSVYSYINVNQAFTQGAELSVQYQIHNNLQIQGGYQYLITADKALLNQVKNGQVFGRDIENGSARLMQRSDYNGLLNRSTHMANLRLFWENSSRKNNASLRFIYRGKWGVQDKDGNGFANMPAEFAPAMLQINFAATHQFNNQWMLQAGINNLLNQTNARFAGNIAGRNVFISVQYALTNKK
jgi:outer membrane receptor for ferrienterochelin and colicins